MNATLNMQITYNKASMAKRTVAAPEHTVAEIVHLPVSGNSGPHASDRSLGY